MTEATVSHETVSNGRRAYWSEADVATLRRLRLEQGWTTAKIAAYMDRGHPAVRTKLARLGLRFQPARTGQRRGRKHFANRAPSGVPA